MSDQQGVASPVQSCADPEPVAFKRWSEDRIRQGLTSSDASERIAALSMVMLPDSPVDALVVEIVRCAGLSRDDENALHIAASALTLMRTPDSQKVAVDALALLAREDMPLPTRICAANGFWLYKTVPVSAWPAVAKMVFADDSLLRQVAFAAALPHAPAGASYIAVATAHAGPHGWTTEGLDLLGASAGGDTRKQQQVESYVLQSLEGATHLPLIVAGYSALARINPSGAAIGALAQVAGRAPTPAEAELALKALRQLGESAKLAIPALVAQLTATDDAEREAQLCETLLALGVSQSEVPLTRVVERVAHGPDSAVVAHCMLLGLHGRAFAAAAPIVAKRFDVASEGLCRVLDAVHEMLTGRPLLVAPSPSSR